MGPITKKERAEITAMSEMADKYDETIDRESAYEVLHDRADERLAQEEKARKREEKEKSRGRKKTKTSKRRSTTKRRSNRQSVGEAAIKSAARTFSSTLAREVLRGVLGGFKRR